MIPLVDLKAQYRNLERALDAALDTVFRSGSYIEGEACRAFEREFAEYCGVAAACGVASGSDALYLALRALGVGPEDEVITTPFSFIANAEAISRNGARIVFADIEADTFNLDPAAVEAAITAKTRAILPVHLYGHPASMNPIAALAEAKGLSIIEDAAQAHGAEIGQKKVGSIGDVGCFSFYPTKNLGAHGDGGMVVSNDESLVERVRLIAHHGEEKKYQHAAVGLNSRLDHLQAALLRVKLRYLDRWNERRREVAAVYRDALETTPSIELPPEVVEGRAVYHQFTIRSAHRDRLRRGLERKGIESAIHYPVPLHLQPALAHLGYEPGSFPMAEKAAQEVLSLPMFPELTDDQAREVAEAVRALVATPT